MAQAKEKIPGLEIDGLAVLETLIERELVFALRGSNRAIHFVKPNYKNSWERATQAFLSGKSDIIQASSKLRDEAFYLYELSGALSRRAAIESDYVKYAERMIKAVDELDVLFPRVLANVELIGNTALKSNWERTFFALKESCRPNIFRGMWSTRELTLRLEAAEDKLAALEPRLRQIHVAEREFLAHDRLSGSGN